MFDSAAGFTAVDLTYREPGDIDQAVVESRGALLSSKKLRWSLWQLESTQDVGHVFLPVPRGFEVSGIEVDDVTTTFAGLTVAGTTLRLGRSAVSMFDIPSRESALVFLRRGSLSNAPVPAFEQLHDLSDAEAERKKLQQRLARGFHGDGVVIN